MSENDVLSHRARLIRELVAEFNQNDFLKTKFRDEKRSESEFEKAYKYPDSFMVEKFNIGKGDKSFKMEFIIPKERDNGWVLLQLHGGGYVGPFKNRYRTFAKTYSEYGQGMSVLTIDYRVAPENPFPAALEDSVSAYEWLLSKGYPADKIILAGDSAGGGLAMSLCHYLKDNNRELPAGIIAMSPWTDLTAAGESYMKKYEVDPIFGNSHESLIYNNPYASEDERTNPYVSPLYGDFEDFPPMLIQVGSDEMLLSDSVSAAQKAKNAGVKVKLSVYEGMFHVFQLAMKLMPESARAWDEIGRFMSLITRKKRADVFRIALIERNIVWEDKLKNLRAVGEILRLIKNREIDLALLPEMSLTGFSMNTEITSELYTDENSGSIKKEASNEINSIDEIKRISEETGINIGVGWVKRLTGSSLCENHYSVVSPDGEVLSDYVKIHPFSYAGEDKFFRGGDKLEVFNMDKINIGTAICYDLRFPEIFSSLSGKSELVLVPANWPAARSLHWSTLLRARAIENQFFIAGVNCCGEMNGQTYSGDSAVYGPEGEILSPIDTISINETDKILIYDIVNKVKDVRERFPVKNDRREFSF